MLWLAVAALVVLPYAHNYRHLSPFDEMVHVDYVVKVQHGHLVNGGEKVGVVAMRAQACRGSDLTGAFKFPRCNQQVMRPAAFPSEGFNTSYHDPPVYYLVTAAGVAVVGLLPGVNDVVLEARSIGVLWLGIGLILTFLLALRLGADRWPAAGATLVVASNPAVAHTMSTVTSDAPSLITGALLCLTALAVVRRQLSWWWLVPVAGATTAVKATGLTVVGLVVVFLLLQLLRRPSDSATTDEEITPSHQPVPRRTVWFAVIATVGAALVSLGVWTVVTAVTSYPAAQDSPMTEAFYVDSIGWPELIGNLLNLMTPLQSGYLPPFMSSVTLAPLMGLVNVLAIAGIAAVAWAGAARAVSLMGVASFLAMLVSGPALVLLIFAGSHTYYPIPPRYGLSLIPAVAACLAVAASRRSVGGYLLTGLGAATLTALMVQIL